MEKLRAKQGFICDMDGVIYHGNMLLPGVKKFIDWLENFFHPEPKPAIARWRPVDFLPLTGSSMYCLDCGNISNTLNGCRCCVSHALLPVEIRGKKPSAILHFRHTPDIDNPGKPQQDAQQSQSGSKVVILGEDQSS